MTLSRRSTIKAIGVVGAGSTLTGTALAVNEHEDDERDPEETPDDDEEVGAIRVGHFSPDAPNVDIYVDDQQILTDVAYDDLSPYLEIVPGTYTVTITAAGDDEPVYEETLSVDSEYYTAAAIGELEGEAEANGLEAENGFEDDDDDLEESETAASVQDDDDEIELDDDEDDAADDDVLEDEPDEDEPDTGTFEVLVLVDGGPDDIEEDDTSHVRVVHASPDAPAVDVADEETGLPLFEDVGFGEPSGYTPVEAGTRTLELFPAGEGDLEDGPDENGVDEDGDEFEDDVEEPDTDAAIQDDDDEIELDDEDEDDEDDVIDQPDPVASAELELEADTVYTAFAIGYLEEQDEDELTVEEDDYANNGDDEFGEDDDEYGEDDDDELGENGDDDEPDEDDRSFTIRVAIDGEMVDEAEPDEPGVEDDELEPEEDEYEDEEEYENGYEEEAEDDEYDDEDENGYDDEAEDDEYGEPADEPATADD